MIHVGFRRSFKLLPPENITSEDATNSSFRLDLACSVRALNRMALRCLSESIPRLPGYSPCLVVASVNARG